MHPFSVLTLAIFVAGYITARWDLVTRLYELAVFAWDHGVVVCCHDCRRGNCANIVLGAHSKRLCDSLDILLSIHNTRGETGFQGNRFGRAIRSGTFHPLTLR